MWPPGAGVGGFLAKLLFHIKIFDSPGLTNV